jgi:hypothetical protein
LSHITPTANRWRRKLLGLPVAVWVWSIAAVALAVAGFIVLLGTSGSFNAANGIDVHYNNHVANSATVQAGTPTCTIQFVSPSEIQIGATGALPGDVCRYRVEMANAGTSDAKLQGFVLPAAAPVTAAVLDAQNGPGCGATLPATSGVGFFAVDITFTAALSPGQVITLNPAQHGFRWVIPNQYNPATCT